VAGREVRGAKPCRALRNGEKKGAAMGRSQWLLEGGTVWVREHGEFVREWGGGRKKRGGCEEIWARMIQGMMGSA